MQKQLAVVLYACIAEIKNNVNPKYLSASYGFQKKRTIISNAEKHRRRRFVFNTDIEDFFGSINFGRVRGFFINDKNFRLHPKIATIIAQIACDNNALPQGSPCSPVISNLIGNILDLRLLSLAKKEKCMYSRYADDLTFSTNKKEFPVKLALEKTQGEWLIGKVLENTIERSGFRVNVSKTRMNLRESRQTVTGLVVNSKVNISQDYYRKSRSMCNSLFNTGKYFLSKDSELTDNFNQLEGILAYIYYVKSRKDRSNKFDDSPVAPATLYKKFLFYKHFVALDSPIIVAEGETDITHMKCAIRSLASDFSSLVNEGEDKVSINVKFLNPTKTTKDSALLNLLEGTGGQAKFIGEYSKMLKKYKHKPLAHPVIILCDNDEGAKKVFSTASGKSKKKVSIDTTDSFYYLENNLYLIKIPEKGSSERAIESLYSQNLLGTQLGNKTFDPSNNYNKGSHYGKMDFAKKVIQSNQSNVDFSGFKPLLDRIVGCIKDYESKLQDGKG